MAEGIVTSSDAKFRGILADSPGPIDQLALKARALSLAARLPPPQAPAS